MMTKELDKRLGKAIDLATQMKHEFVTLDHLLFCLVESPLIIDVLEQLGTDPTKIKKEIKVFIDKIPTLKKVDPDWKSNLTLSVHRVFEKAALQMQNAGRNELSETAVFIEIFDESKSNASYVLQKLGLSQFDVTDLIFDESKSNASYVLQKLGLSHQIVTDLIFAVHKKRWI